MRAQSVADYFIKRSREADGAEPEARRMSPLKLQKILYYAQGWYLGVYGKPLFDDTIYAWKFGPVTKTVYDNLKHYGSQNLVDSDWDCSGLKIDSETQKFLDYTWGQYAVESAPALVARTHNSDPWLSAYGNPVSKQITPAAMEKHFQKMV